MNAHTNKTIAPLTQTLMSSATAQFTSASPASEAEYLYIPLLPSASTLDFNPENKYVLVKARQGEDQNMNWLTAYDYCRDEVHSTLAVVDKETDQYGTQREQIDEMNAFCYAGVQQYFDDDLDEEIFGETTACHIGLLWDKGATRFRWLNEQHLEPSTSECLDSSNCILSETDWGHTGQAATPHAGFIFDQYCVTIHTNSILGRRGWTTQKCGTCRVDRDFNDKAVIMCMNPFYGISSCSSNSDCRRQWYLQKQHRYMCPGFC